MLKRLWGSLRRATNADSRLRAPESSKVCETVVRSCNVGVAWESKELYRDADERRIHRDRSRGCGRRHGDGIGMTYCQEGDKDSKEVRECHQ